MDRIMSWIVDEVKSKAGIPVQIQKAIAQYPHLVTPTPKPVKSVSLYDVEPWHKWTQNNKFGFRQAPGELVGWGYDGYRYCSFHRKLQPMVDLTQLDVISDIHCDILHVDGLSASKSNLNSFISLDELVETNSADMIDEITLAKLEKNLAHSEIRILQKDSGDFFSFIAWDGRLFLVNSGGSHHFSAARYIAARIKEAVPLSGKLHVYQLNRDAIMSLRDEFVVLALSDEPYAANAFDDAMRAFNASYLLHSLPDTFGDAKAIFFPKADKRSMAVVNEFVTAGAVDLLGHLATLCDRQAGNISKLSEFSL